MIKKSYVYPHAELCRNCDGKGFNMVDTAPILMGKGEIVKESCTVCGGMGRVIVSKVVETKIVPFDVKLLNV